MKTTLSMQCGAPYIPIPKGRGFTANPDKYCLSNGFGFCLQYKQEFTRCAKIDY